MPNLLMDLRTYLTDAGMDQVYAWHLPASGPAMAEEEAVGLSEYAGAVEQEGRVGVLRNIQIKVRRRQRQTGMNDACKIMELLDSGLNNRPLQLPHGTMLCRVRQMPFLLETDSFGRHIFVVNAVLHAPFVSETLPQGGEPLEGLTDCCFWLNGAMCSLQATRFTFNTFETAGTVGSTKQWLADDELFCERVQAGTDGISGFGGVMSLSGVPLAVLGELAGTYSSQHGVWRHGSGKTVALRFAVQRGAGKRFFSFPQAQVQSVLPDAFAAEASGVQWKIHWRFFGETPWEVWDES